MDLQIHTLTTGIFQGKGFNLMALPNAVGFFRFLHFCILNFALYAGIINGNDSL